MRPSEFSHLTETIYSAAVDQSVWPEVMAFLRRTFKSQVEAFYILDFARQSKKVVHVGGLDEFYWKSFDDRYFTADNPWMHSEPLHRPGVVRTDKSLAEYFRDARILRKSQYYNDWLRPQGIAHSLGVTLLAENGAKANLTLLRPAEAGCYSMREVRQFGRISEHLRRAARIALRLESASDGSRLALQALNSLPYGAVFLNSKGKILYCNESADALLREGDAITARGGRLTAVEQGDAQDLAGMLDRVASDPTEEAGIGPDSLAIRRPNQAGTLVLNAVRLPADQRAFATACPSVFVLIVDTSSMRTSDGERFRRSYALTEGEARLAQALVSGNSVKQAADAMGITYETARWYLKILFQKTETNRQGELVARLLGDAAVRIKPPTRH